MKLKTADEAKSCHEAKNRMKMGANEAENSLTKLKTAYGAKNS
jgi:hypothetical protein